MSTSTSERTARNQLDMLQEFHTRYSQSYKAGHSMWRTKLTSIAEEPQTSTALLIHDLNTATWITFPDETPFRYLD
jgi:hypothetical protein